MVNISQLLIVNFFSRLIFFIIIAGTFDIPEFDFRKSNVISNSSSYNYRLPSTDQQFEPTSVIPGTFIVLKL